MFSPRPLRPEAQVAATDDDERYVFESDSFVLTLILDEFVTATLLLDQVEDHLCLINYESISFLRIHVMGETRFLSADVHEAIGELVNKCTSLERMMIRDVTGFAPGPTAGTSIRIPTLLSPLRQSHSLTHLNVETLSLDGTIDDFNSLHDVIQSMVALESIDLAITNCVPPNSAGESKTHLLDPILRALSTLKRLSNISIYGHSPLGRLSNDTLKQLCQMKELTSLHLVSFDMTSDNASCMAASLENNSSLEELHLDCFLDQTASSDIASMLQSNKVLTELRLFCRNLPTEDSWSLDLLSGIGSSRYLQSFELHADRVTERSLQCLRDLMITNYNLQSVDFFVGSSHDALESDILFYTDLNLLGRGALFREEKEATVNDWIDAVAKAKDDLSQIFYFLAEKPSICYQTTVNIKRGYPYGDSVDQAPHVSKRVRLYRSAKYGVVDYK